MLLPPISTIHRRWTGPGVELVADPDGEDRDARARTEECRLRQPTAGRMGRAVGCPSPTRRQRDRLEVSAEDDSAAAAQASWPLPHRRRLRESMQDLRAAARRSNAASRCPTADAFTARVLLIHRYRRVVLRDRLLPTALLPEDWPGRAAGSFCANLSWSHPASEQWLDRPASNENGRAADGRRRTGARVARPSTYYKIL